MRSSLPKVSLTLVVCCFHLDILASFMTEIEGKPDDDDLTIWEDNWDDDNIEDDFCKQLKQELEKQKLDSVEQMQ